MDIAASKLVADVLPIGHLLPRPNTTTPPTISPLSTIKVPLRLRKLRLARTFDRQNSGYKNTLTQKSEQTRTVAWRLDFELAKAAAYRLAGLSLIHISEPTRPY